MAHGTRAQAIAGSTTILPDIRTISIATTTSTDDIFATEDSQQSTENTKAAPAVPLLYFQLMINNTIPPKQMISPTNNTFPNFSSCKIP